MTGVADWLMQRRVSRIVIIALLFPAPVLTVVSSATVVLVSSLRGWRLAAADCVAAGGLLVVLVGLTGGSWLGIVLGAGLTWAVAGFLGYLRRIGSVTLAVQSAVLLGMAGVVGFMVWSPNPQAYWEQVLADFAERARTAGLPVGLADLPSAAVQVMTGMMSASAVASAVAALFLGSWAAGPINDRPFGQEFRDLRMGRVIGLVGLGTAIMLVTGLRSIADDLMVVLAFGFVVQGLAVVHWYAAQREWPRAWPLLVYLPLAVPAILLAEVLGLGLLGVVDNSYSLRRSGNKVV